VTVRGLPDIFPINYVVDHGAVVFRTAEGTKLSAVAGNPAVAFEVDGWEGERREAWSVVVAGRGRRVQDTDELIDSMQLPLYPWHAGRKECLVRIVVDRISGRRFEEADPVIWQTRVTNARRTRPD
jgi:nitroimidazol reductase NimA-like FMN-containing flavoprotein (pyridoxamine 5'-phosphate oxidase superfamily)